MQFRKFDRIDKDISLLGFGCMRMPTTETEEIDKEKAFAMLDYAYKSGVNYYDTAYFYHDGESESVLGEWLKTIERQTVNVVTKSPVHLCNSTEDFYRIFAEQQEKLGVEFIDFYLLHALDYDRYVNRIKAFDLLTALSDLKERGLVGKVGFSFHDSYEVFEEIINAYDWDFCQIQLNYMDLEHQAGIKGYELATSKSIPVVIMEPIKGGLLSDVPQEIRDNFATLHPDWSDARWALSWVASLSNVMTVLSGMSTLDQVEDNVLTMSECQPLSQAEQAIIEKAGELFRSRSRIPCTQCQYCMPCPYGVRIPNNFRYYNTAFIYDDVERAKSSYAFMSEKGRANNCIECGSCVPKCPQHIDIPEELKKVVSLFK